MEVRDAVEADADALATLADSPADVMRGVIHDRSVRVVDSGAADALRGFVSFDARSDTVYVTQLAGDSIETCKRLLSEPCRFADCETMAVEFVVEAADEEAREAAERAGFEDVGPGPHFDGAETRRYRLSEGA
jgi:hypothetical protein